MIPNKPNPGCVYIVLEGEALFRGSSISLTQSRSISTDMTRPASTRRCTVHH